RFYEQYQAGKLDAHEYQRFALQPLIDNYAERMRALREQFVRERIDPTIAAQARALIASRRAAGDVLAIITATNSFITAPIATLLGIAHLIACETEIIDGRCTGNIAGVPCFQGGKIQRLTEWLNSQPQAFA